MPSRKKLDQQADIFAQSLHEGKSQRTAYRESHPDSTAADETADVQGCRWAQSDKVLIRLKELQEKADKGAILRREQRQALLSEIATNPNEATGSRLSAMDQLSKMEGSYLDRHEVAATVHTTVDLDAKREEVRSAVLEYLREANS